MSIILRNKSWHLVRRVPRRFRAVEPRTQVWISLHTDSESVAKMKAPRAWQDLEAAWEAKLSGSDDDAEARFAAARALANQKGFGYVPAAEVIMVSREDFVRRAEAISESSTGIPDHLEAKALLGTVQAPAVTVSRAMELFFDYVRGEEVGMSKQQVRRRQSDVRGPIQHFISVVGDRAIDKVTREDMRAFRDWFIDRVEIDGLNPDTANKNMDHFRKVLKRVNEEQKLDIELPFGQGLRLRTEKKRRRVRPAFSDEWIRDKLLAPGALDELHPEARAIFLVMINTGARPSELQNLRRAQIKLNDDVPRIEIAPIERALKTVNAPREIPLTGVSLKAIKAFPEGFPHYLGNLELSRDINDHLTAKGLRETPKHVMYSLRHRFEDRMLEGGIDPRIRRDLMGHEIDVERYGQGGHLRFKRDLLQAIAI